MVNTGVLMPLFSVAVPDHASESYFVMRHPQDPTLHAIYVTVLVMYILYQLPCCSTAVLLAGMRSILKSQVSFRSLASEVPMDPQKLLLTYDLDPVTGAMFAARCAIFSMNTPSPGQERGKCMILPTTIMITLRRLTAK